MVDYRLISGKDGERGQQHCQVLANIFVFIADLSAKNSQMLSAYFPIF